MKSILFKPSVNMPTMQAVTIRCITGNARGAVAAISEAMAAGQYEAKAMLRSMPDAESIFDYVNLDNPCGISAMSVGDVIIWADGRREACMPDHWAEF